MATNAAWAKDIPNNAYIPAIEASCTPSPPGMKDRLPADRPMPNPDKSTPTFGVLPRAPKQNQSATASNAHSPAINANSRVNSHWRFFKVIRPRVRRMIEIIEKWRYIVVSKKVPDRFDKME